MHVSNYYNNWTSTSFDFYYFYANARLGTLINIGFTISNSKLKYLSTRVFYISSTLSHWKTNIVFLQGKTFEAKIEDERKVIFNFMDGND